VEGLRSAAVVLMKKEGYLSKKEWAAVDAQVSLTNWLCAGADLVGAPAAPADQPATRYEGLCLKQLAVHSAIAAVSGGQNTFFFTLLLKAADTMTSYVPTMPDDAFLAALAAVEAGERNRHGRLKWYVCFRKLGLPPAQNG
jgi:hypothetical protein